MGYSAKNIVDQLNGDLNSLYKKNIVNYTGIDDCGERYTEIIAKELLKPINLKKLNAIKQIDRKKYNVHNHAFLSTATKPDSSNRAEEWLAKDLYIQKQVFNIIGKIIDFQVPLKSIQTDESGKIDLLAYNENTKMLHILELKRSGSKETLLRCVLEVYTYWKTVNKANLLESFQLPPDTELRKAVLIYADSQSYADLNDRDIFIKQLMRKLEVDFCVLNHNNTQIIDYRTSHKL